MCRLERKRAIHSKSYLRTFLWILNKTIVEVGEVLQKLLLLKVFSTSVLKHNYFFCDSAF